MKGEEDRTIAGKSVKPTEICKWMFKKALLFSGLSVRERENNSAGRKWATEKRKWDTGHPGEVTLRWCGNTMHISKTKGERYGSGGKWVGELTEQGEAGVNVWFHLFFLWRNRKFWEEKGEQEVRIHRNLLKRRNRTTQGLVYTWSLTELMRNNKCLSLQSR